MQVRVCVFIFLYQLTHCNSENICICMRYKNAVLNIFTVAFCLLFFMVFISLSFRFIVPCIERERTLDAINDACSHSCPLFISNSKSETTEPSDKSAHNALTGFFLLFSFVFHRCDVILKFKIDPLLLFVCITQAI